MPLSAADEARHFNEELERTLATGTRIERLAPQVTRDGRRVARGIFGRPVFLEQARTTPVSGEQGRSRSVCSCPTAPRAPTCASTAAAG